jgi:hypothetical protein
LTQKNNRRLPRFAVAAALAIGLLGVTGCAPDNQTSRARPQEASDRHGPPTVEGAEKALGSPEVKTFGGSDKLPIGGPLASITLPQSDREKQFLKDFGCFEESECFTRSKFERYFLALYPDIARVHFKLPSELAGDDKEDIEYMKENFRRGLFYAKQIKLADGRPLFDLLTKCSKTVSPDNWAEVTYDPGSEQRHVVMQFFPVLRQDATGNDFELQILLDRKGDTIEARSPAFSSSILRDANFMEKHGVSCYRSKS